jgi:hypothetical protein
MDSSNGTDFLVKIQTGTLYQLCETVYNLYIIYYVWPVLLYTSNLVIKDT